MSPRCLDAWDAGARLLRRESRERSDAPFDRYFRQGMGRTFGGNSVPASTADVARARLTSSATPWLTLLITL